MKETNCPILYQLEKNALGVAAPVQQRVLYWKTFAKLQLELLGLGHLVEPNAMSLTVAFGGDTTPSRTVTYRRVSAEEFARCSSMTPQHHGVEYVPSEGQRHGPEDTKE